MVDLNVKLETSEVLEYIKNASDATVYMTNDIVAKVAKNARGAAKRIEGQALKMGGVHMYWRSKKSKWHTSTSRWDDKSKSYRTPNRKGGKKSGGGDFRLEHFWFGKAAGPGDILAPRATGKLTSQIANLHDRDVRFPRGSVLFSYDTSRPKTGKGKWNRKKQWRRYKPGDIRKGRNFFHMYEQEALATLPASEDEVLTKWNLRVNNGVQR